MAFLVRLVGFVDEIFCWSVGQSRGGGVAVAWVTVWMAYAIPVMHDYLP